MDKALKKNPFLKSAIDELGEMREIRHDLHKHPELGMQEHRTAKLIYDYLKNLDIEVKSGIGGTGVVGLLRGKGRGKTVALRADIDALPMQDKINKDYASKNSGVAHSCGHDGHTAIQLGVARMLSTLKDKFYGNIKFIFQPSEDTLPGGAVPMIRDKVLENPEVDAMFSLHLYPLFREGTVAVKRGTASLASSSFTLKVIGHGGHIAFPHKVINPLLLSALIIINTQTILPKILEPTEPLIFDFASIHGGTAGNIIPSEVTLKGNIRVSSLELMDRLIRYFERYIDGVVQSAGGKYTLDLQNGYPPIINNPELVSLFIKSAAKVLGNDNVIEYDKITATGDDVAYFHNHVPGVYWWLGVRNDEMGFTHSLHSSEFDFNEDVMAIGAAIQAQTVWDFLNEN